MSGASSAGSRAGVHLDGVTATVAIVHGPVPPAVEAVHQVVGTSAADALRRALKLIPTTYTTRVTVSTTGVATATMDITAAHLTRRGFTTAARLRLPNAQASSPVAGILGDLTKVAAGELETGLAFTAPGDLIDDLYAAAGDHTLEVTTTSASAHAAVDGLHLFLRRDSLELTIVSGGKVHLAHLFDTPGFDHLLEAVNHHPERFSRALAGEPGDPLAAAVLHRLLQRAFEETREVLDAHATVPGALGNELAVHGIGVDATTLHATAMEHGFRINPTTGVRGIDHTAFDAYCAAVTAGADMPYAAFLDRAQVTARRHELAAAERRHLARAGVAYLAAATLGLIGPLAAATGWQAWTSRELHGAYAAAQAHPTQARALLDVRLRATDAAQAGPTRALAAARAAAEAANGQVHLSALEVRDHTLTLTATGPNDALDTWVGKVRDHVVLDTVDYTDGSVTLTSAGATR